MISIPTKYLMLKNIAINDNIFTSEKSTQYYLLIVLNEKLIYVIVRSRFFRYFVLMTFYISIDYL